jgi:DNA polymerase-1
MDLEADHLLRHATKTHIVGWLNKDTREMRYWLEGDLSWKEELDKATVIIGHNIAGYDLPLLKKLFGWTPRPSVKIQDTMLMSLVLDYNKFPQGRHSLENWGEYLGFPKIKFNDFSKFTPEMLTYWKRDIEITDKVHDQVFDLFNTIFARNKKIATYLKAENYVSRFAAEAELHGWPFDKPRAEALLAEIGAVMDSTRNKLLPRLGTKTVAVDKSKGVVEPKMPKWIKSGAYDKHTADWFGISPWNGVDDRLVEGPYSRITFEPLDVNSISDMKIFLFRNGWVPTEYNTKPNPEGRGKIRTTPKITEDSLECLHGDGKLYCDFLTNSSRYNVLKGWIEACDENNRLHGVCFTIGTPSMRARHSVIVNVPAADSAWGKEMRSLFTVPEGYVMVGADSAGNQARGLAFFLEDAEYIHRLLHGDTHQFNADTLTAVLRGMGIDHVVPRSVAKRILYAFLFGASGGKMWSYIFGRADDEKGKKLKLGFTKAVPGLKALLDKLENIFGKTKQFGDGYIPGIAGNRIYCDSFHKLLVYMLQATEKATCGAAIMLTMQRLEAAGIPYQPLIFMHDEEDFMVPEEYAEQAQAISKQAFIDGPKLFGIEIMDGESKIGKTWYDVH